MQIGRRPSIFNFVLASGLIAVLGGAERASAQCAAADINGSGTVDAQDLNAVLASWNTNDADSDVNGDGFVAGEDLLLVLAAWGNPCTTTWQANDYQLQVNGQPFFVKGVSYQPIPWGGSAKWPPNGDFYTPPWNAIWERDLPNIRSLNMNTIRTYNIDLAHGDHSAFFSACYGGGVAPVYVLVGFGELNTPVLYDPPNPTGFATAKENFTQLVQTYGSNPAIMGFIVGNEVNTNITRDMDSFWQGINELCGVVKTYAPGKLAILACVDDSMATIVAGENNPHLTHLDVWGINSYRGTSAPTSANFDILWSSFRNATNTSKRPLMLTEWGAPASSHTAAGDLQFDTATMNLLVDYITGHYNDITYNASTTTSNGAPSNPNSSNWAPVGVGSCYFAWSDEIWKMDDDHTGVQCPATVQQPGIATNAAFPGGWDDEECYGLHSIEADGTVCPPANRCTGGNPCPGPYNPCANQPYPPDILTPRDSATTLGNLMAK